MSLSRTVVCACLLALTSTAIATEKPAFNAATAQMQLPLMFEVNRGQTDARARYLARGPGYTLFLTDREAVLRLSNAEKGSVVRLRPVNAAVTQMIGEQPLSGRVNYLTANHPKDWITNVPLYERVRYQSVQPGVDLLHYGKQGRLEYDFVVAAGSDPKKIAVEIAGADALRVDANGDLLIRSGEFDLRWKKPFAYQQAGSARKEIPSQYVLAGNRVSFKLGDYDRTRELVIDPALVYSTYLGGSTDSDPFDGDGTPGSALNFIAGIAADSSGNAYILGSTTANDFPVTSGAYDTTENGGNCNPHGGHCSSFFITKLNSSGTALVYSTYFGKGSFIPFDPSGDIAIDGNGRVYVIGTVGFDSGVPTTTNAFNLEDRSCDGECNEYGFLSVLNSSGSSLVYSTLIGGKSNSGDFHFTHANGVTVGTSGVAYVTGHTDAVDFVTTPNAYQPAKAGADDAFLVKINPALTGPASVLYSSYLGGTGSDSGEGVATESGRVYLVGATRSGDFPTTSGAFNRTHAGDFDAFIAKLDTNQAGRPSLVYSTYYGGGDVDVGRDVALSGTAAYLVGETRSSNLPTTTGAFDRSYAGAQDAFVAKLNSSGSGLVYATYLGGTNNDSGAAIAVDSSGAASVSGSTVSSNFPTTADAFDRTFNDGTCDGPCTDAFLAKLSASGSSLAYSTYFGGSERDVATGIALSGSNAYLAGNTFSANLPTTSGAFDRTRTGTRDGFAAKFNMSSSSSGCSPGSNARSVRICQPQDGSTQNSPVHISAAARPGSNPILRMEVWVDGQKKHQQQDTNALEADVPMAAGSRRVTVQAADSAGTFKSTVFINVGGGGPCPAPSENRTVNICEPADGATVDSPVRIRAAAHSSSGVKFTQVYVDGSRVHHVDSASVDTSLPMAAGTRRITVQSKDNSSDVAFKETIFITVR